MIYNKAMTVQYIGSNFAGWQVQNGDRTVQEEINKALTTMFKERTTCVGSGRTDSGVHALGQVANFRSEKNLTPKAVLFGLNSLLPEDISISDVWEVGEEFHAQRSAKDKTYQYLILSSKVRSAIYQDRVWWYKHNLDFERATELTKLFLGEHDFTSFCVEKSLKENNARTINSFDTFMKDGICHFEINGSGFLHNMVRIIMGTIVEACQKGYGDDYITNALSGKNRDLAGPTAPAAGLYLKSVNY